MVVMNLKDCTETKKLIARGGFTLRGFANNISMSHAYLSQIVNGKRHPSPEIAHKIASGLDKGIEDIFLIKMLDNNEQEMN